MDKLKGMLKSLKETKSYWLLYLQCLLWLLLISLEKVVKHFGNTGSLGKKIPRHNQENISKPQYRIHLEQCCNKHKQQYDNKENISKEAIAKDLEIDENIFEDDK